LVFGPQVLDHEPLLTIDLTGQDEEIELPGMQGEVHRCSGCRICVVRGCLSLFGDKLPLHRLLAEHLTAEYFVKTEGRGRIVDE